MDTMVLPDDVIALVHDLSSDGLAVTLIGPPVKRPKGKALLDLSSKGGTK